MNFYMTSGTGDFLQTLIEKHPHENLILLEGQGKAIVLHETTGKSIFSLPKKYEVADAFGNLLQKGFFVLYHLSIEGGRRDLFKQQFLKVSTSLKNDSSLISYRLLLPKKNSEHIVFISQWGGPASYEVWTNSELYKTNFASLFQMEASSVQKIFDGESYVATYSAREVE